MKRRYLIAFAILLALGLITLLIPETHDESSLLGTPSPPIPMQSDNTHSPVATDAPLSDQEFLLAQPDFNNDASTINLLGRVTTPDGGRIPNARLEIDGPTRASSVSDANGDFRVPDIQPGIYQIDVEHDRYKSISKRIRVHENKQLEMILPWITVRGTVSGQGIDLPIERFDVHWSQSDRPNDTGDLRQQFHHTSGAFELEYSKHKYNAIRVTALGYKPKLIPLTDFAHSNDALEARIVLLPIDALIGSVINENGEAIAGARIFRDESRNDPEQANEHTLTYSGQDGRFRVPDYGPGIAYFVATHPDYATGYTIYDPENDLDEIVITLPLGSTLSGIVTYKNSPVANTKIQTISLENEAFSPWQTKTNPDGTYQIDNLPTGNFIIDCDGDGKVNGEPFTLSGSVRIETTVIAGEDIIQDFDLPNESGRLEGSLEYDHTQTNGIDLMAESVGREFVVRKEAENPTEDSYLFKDIAPGEWDLIAVNLSRFEIGISRHRVTIHPDETTIIDIDLSGSDGTITGTLYNARESILILYEGNLDYSGERFFQDVHRLMEVEEIPQHFKSFYITEFSTVSNPNEYPSYRFGNLSDGDYTLLGSNILETPFLLHSKTAPYIIEHITVKDGEVVQVDVEF